MDYIFRGTYTEKLVVSGSVLEYYQYEVPIKRERPMRRYSPYRRRKLPDLPIIRLNNINRRKKAIRRLILCNPTLRKFITLTFKEDIKSLPIAHKKFMYFCRKLSRRFPNFKYLAVPEFQPNSGRVHYHLLSNIPYIKLDLLNKLWSYGYTDIKFIKFNDTLHIAHYIAKYITKDNSGAFYNKKRFFYSKNLSTSLICDDPILIEYYKDLYKISSKVSQFEKILTTRWLGRIIYNRYNVEGNLTPVK